MLFYLKFSIEYSQPRLEVNYVLLLKRTIISFIAQRKLFNQRDGPFITFIREDY